MPPAAERTPGASPEDLRAAIQAFLGKCAQPALLEPGEELLPLVEDGFALEIRGSRLSLQAWDRTRNLVRRVLAVKGEAGGRMELSIERFARKEGPLFLLDLSRKAGADLGRRGSRMAFRERFRLFLRRQFPEWNLAEISTEPDLEHTLSPAYPRATLRHGQHAWAAIACPPDSDAAGVLSFGLIWLSYLRAREKRAVVEGLAIYVPAGHERTTALRLLHLDPAACRFELFSYSEQDFVTGVDLRDQGNVGTRLEPCRRAASLPDAFERIAALPGVEQAPKHDGRVSLRVHGVEFAEVSERGVSFGLGERVNSGGASIDEICRLAGELARARSPHAADRDHPLFRRAPEAWLESQARAQLETLDASLLPAPVYTQAPAIAGGERGVVDLLAVDRAGRLAVLEFKATADLHLPLQALDYWIAVNWHLERGEFPQAGYFPGVTLLPAPPRLLLVSPALEFHPSTETILGFFSPRVPVVRIGVGVEWRIGLQVMFRLHGAERPR